MDEVQRELHCDGCGELFRRADRAVLTQCSHILCETCIKQLFAGGSTNLHPDGPACPDCKTPLRKKLLKVLTVLQDPAELAAHLQGSDPLTILNAAKSAISFWMQRTHHYYTTETDALRNQLQEQYTKCKSKLSELHNGYQQAKRKYHEAIEQRAQLQEDLQELQDKHEQVLRQCTELRNRNQALEMHHAPTRLPNQPSHGNHGGQQHRTLRGGARGHTPDDFDAFAIEPLAPQHPPGANALVAVNHARFGHTQAVSPNTMHTMMYGGGTTPNGRPPSATYGARHRLGQPPLGSVLGGPPNVSPLSSPNLLATMTRHVQGGNVQQRGHHNTTRNLDVAFDFGAGSGGGMHLQSKRASHAGGWDR